MDLERLTLRDLQCLFRALLEYEKALTLSALADSDVVADELHRALKLQEKVSLLAFCGADEEVDHAA